MFSAVSRLSDQIEITGQTIADLSVREDADSMRALIQARKDLAAQLPELLQVCASATTLLPLSESKEASSKLNLLGNEFRHQLASLQSRWPSVTIRTDTNGYALQKRELARAEAAFFGWLTGEYLPAVGRVSR